MYLNYFGLNEPCFSITPDPRFLYLSEEHREALAHLLYGAGEGGGFVLLTGEVGTGKTTICRAFLEQLPQDVDIALILNPALTAADLLHTICEEFGIRLPADTESPRVLVTRLNQYLLEAHARNRRSVLLIDEAQNLSSEVLEQIRLLTNLETHTNKLLQIFLVGQPELRELLNSRELRQLSQRITARYHLMPLSRQESDDYIASRLAVAGVDRALFTPAALKQVFQLSDGIPRLINILCDRALLGAYATHKQMVSRSIVIRSAGEVMDKPATSHQTKTWLALFLVLTFCGGLFLYGWENNLLYQAAELQTPKRTDSHKVTTQSAVNPIGLLKPLERAETPVFTTDKKTANNLVESKINPVENVEPVAQPDIERMLVNWESGMTAVLAYWGVNPNQQKILKDPCAYALAHGLRCYRSSGSWEKLRRFDRPILVELKKGEEKKYLLVSGLDSQYATLTKEGVSIRLPLLSVTPHWRVNFHLIWKPPPSGDTIIRPGSSSIAVQWLHDTLSALPDAAVGSSTAGKFGPAMRESARRFQQQQGLTPDGVVGPETIIHLNTVAGTPGIPRLKQSH